MKRALVLVVLAGCAKESRDAAPVSFPACGAAPAADGAADAVTGIAPAWRAELGKSGALVGAADGVILARREDKGTIAIDAETGATCATILPEIASPIDPHSTRSVMLGGALVGPSGLRVSAVDVHTGLLRWTKTLLGTIGDMPDESLLATSLHIVGAGPLVVVGFPIHFQGKDGSRYEELLVAVDAKTGTERWRRTVVTHPTDQAIPRGGTIALAADATHVFVRTAKELVAFETTGADAWTVPLPETGAPALLAASSGRVALAEASGAINVYHANNGTSLASANLGHTPTALVFGPTLLYAATDAPEVVAIDPAAGKSVFVHRAAYSVAVLRADDATVLSIEGNGRALALDAKTGETQWGVAVGPVYDATLLRTKAGAARLVIPSRGIAAFDPAPGTKPKKGESFLRWDFTSTNAACRARAVAWVDGDENVVWTHDVPQHVHDGGWGASCDEGAIAEYRRHPRGSETLLVGLIGGGTFGEVLAFADAHGIWALSKTDGHVFLDAALPGYDKPGSTLFFDDGTFHLGGNPPCDGPSASAQVFTRCGDHLLYFNGKTAAYVSMSPWRVETRATFTPSSLLSSANPAETGAMLHLGTRELVIRGTSSLQ